MKILKSIAVTATMLALCAQNGFAARQNTAQMSGQVKDEADGETLGWATVALMNADSTIVNGVSCDDKGAYTLQVSPGTYIMKVSLIGYNDYTRNVTLKNGENNMDVVYLTQDSQMLAGATVSEKVKLVEMKLDKLVMNVSQSAFAQGSNALELIKKAPGVTIDKDGNVKLNGKSVSVWIDGRPSYADGKSLESLLKSTNGESIDKFEIMEHPSSKYDASGQGGIINIKTKRNILAGLNGSMGLGGGGMHFKDISSTPWEQSYWLNLAYRTEKTNTFFNIYEGLENTPLRIVNQLNIPASELSQKGVTTLQNFSHNYNVKLGNDWFLDKKNTLGFILYVPGDYGTSKAENSVTEQMIAGARQMKSVSDISDFSKSIQYTANLNYTHVFDESLSSEITTNLDYYKNVGKEENTQDDESVFDAAPDVVIFSNQSITADKIYDIYSAKADFQSVIFQKFMFESGAKWALSVTDNHSKELRTMVPDQEVSFGYREHVGAAYFTVAGQLSPKITAKAGLRGEYTNSVGDWISAGTKTTRKYFDLFPTAFLGYNPNENWRFSASYTRRIDRPNYIQLNPTKTYMDSKTYLKGNPDMMPQYSHNSSLSVGYGQYLYLAAGMGNTKNVMSQVPSYESDGTQYFTFDNYGNQNLLHLSLGVSALPIGKWLQWTLNVVGLYVEASYEQLNTRTKSMGVQGYTELSFVLPKNWRIDWDANYSSPIHLALYKMRTMFSSDIAVKKSILEDKLTFTLSCNDVFRTLNNDLEINHEGADGPNTVIAQKYYAQKVGLNVTWNFGKAKPTRQRNVGNLEEISRAGNSGLGN